MLVDAHCHLDLLAGVPRAAQRALARGIVGVVVAGVSPSKWPHQGAVAERWRAEGGQAWTTIGLHPWAVAGCQVDDELAELAAVLEDIPADVVALGELGLDHRVARTEDARAEQLRVFRTQLDLARHHNLPIVLHAVGADDAMMRILRGDGLPVAGGMVHGFTGSADQANAWINAGLHLSIGGPATWRVSAKRIGGMQAIPADRLLVETDAPDQPIASRGRRPGRPVDLIEVVHALARLRGEAPTVLGDHTARNARRLLGLDRAG